jgi:hypothetical protein
MFLVVSKLLSTMVFRMHHVYSDIYIT